MINNFNVERSSATAVAYIRVSTDKQELGPQVQHESIALWADTNSIPVQQVFEDIGVSGSISPTKRPGSSAMLEYIAVHSPDFVVVHSRDRMSRDFTEMVLLEATLKKYGCRVITSVDDTTEPSDAEKLLGRILDGVSEYERSLIRTRTKDGVRKAREQGRLPGPKTWDTFERGRLTIQLVKVLKHRENMTNTQIVNYFHTNDVLTPHRGNFTHAHINKCLRSLYPEAKLEVSEIDLLDAVKASPYYETKTKKVG